MRKIETNEWWSQLVKMKDELSLRELAERFEVTPGAISAALKRNGLTRKSAPPGPRSRRKIALPPEPGEAANPAKKGKAARTTKAAKASRSPRKRVVRDVPSATEGKAQGRGTDQRIRHYVDLLGTRPDGEIAAKAGVSVRAVSDYRTREGIKGYTGPKRRGKDRKPRRSKIDPFREQLGQVPDRVVAEMAGVSLNAVRNYRVKRGIAARGRGRPKAGTVPPPGQANAPVPVAASPPVAPSGTSMVWKVRLGDGDVVAVAATSLALAATRAEALGDVVSMEKVGRLV